MKSDIGKVGNPTSDKKRLHVYATAMLCSNSGKEYEYKIHFHINPENGLPRFVSEKGKISVRPYMLLHLLIRVYEENSIQIGAPRKAEVQYVKNPKQHPKGKYAYHPALKIFKSGKRYRLDQQVKGDWLSTPDILKMVRYIQNLQFYDEMTYERMCAEGERSPYHTLNPVHTKMWACEYKIED
jgi:hypothetical protein